MGCDFEIQIQVLFRNKWIPVIFLGTKTKCGGFPLGHATRTVYKKKEIKENYRFDDSVAFLYKHSLEYLGLPQETNSDYVSERENEIEAEWIEQYENKYQWFLFYSKQQF
jgi:hypothetical protein